LPERLVTPPVVEPVSIAEAKAHLVVETADDDALIATCLIAAREHAEGFCNRKFVTQTWQALFSAFPASSTPDGQKDVYLELSRGNLADPDVEVTYVDENGDVQTLDPSVYLVDDATVPARVRLAPDGSWPSVQTRWDAVRVEYIVGWEPEAVPSSVKQAIAILVSQMYEHRTPEVTGTITASVKFSFEALLSQHRIIYL